ncbi:hypothetical protein A5819_003651 [Enterococcus sp. 7E2_DIV0204]|uniref:GNAT family N-acetyltransferase n=1 Tax=unclassified Enterococcus TaxID=2608891 RepID=UPI000A345FD2|nr:MULTISPECIES: GNAT family N-acetyltransferase [unclassified Enterococcus]OTN83832.1 hypothetical protein A5819_003651 [Enterococcus sp. 7E2_DIV0204]OTP47526.1 hypothetical protein A5884_003497 [Enterococcus sp. 7D2_DIV0200]
MHLSLEHAKIHDLARIMEIMDACKGLLKKVDSSQWEGKDEPSTDEIKKEILKENCYVLKFESEIVGSSIIHTDPIKAYENIQYGVWDIIDKSSEYASIHRFAIDPKRGGRGYGKLFLELIIVLLMNMGVNDIRIDTSPENSYMQKVILYNGFSFKGIIRLDVEDGIRYAFQFN